MRIRLMCVWLTVMSSAVLADSTMTRVVYAVRTNSPVIDGVLESDWFKAAAADNFVQQQPVEDAPPTLPTRVYFLFDEHNLYVGTFCYDTAPDSVAGRIMRRDNERNSDLIDIYLDTFHDKRNAYWWTITAAGVQSEGTVTNQSNFDNSLDMVWESAAGLTDSGWVVEARIPFQSIRHGGARADGWGVNVSRWVERRQERSYWAPMKRDVGYRVSEMGTLMGLSDIARSQHIEVLPHVLGRWDAASFVRKNDLGERVPGGKWQSGNEWENVGGYVKIVPGRSWTVDLAYQPDFAQVDVDNEVINVSDYPVFLQEKRPFFIEAKDLFDNASTQLLYTRRIIDPDYGGKVSGQQGRFRTSVLAARNRGEGGAYANVAAGRYQWNLGSVHTIGATTTFMDSASFHAAAANVDARFRWRDQDRLLFSFAGVERSGNNEQPVEGILAFLRDYGLFRSDWALRYRGIDYNINDLGWGEVSNMRQISNWFGDEYFPKKTLWRSIGWDLNSYYRMLADGEHPSGGASLGFYSRTKSNWWFGGGSEWGVSQRRKYAFDGSHRDNFGTFNLRRHPYRWHWMWIDSANRYWVEAHPYFGFGTFREGKQFEFSQSVTFKPRANLDISPEISWVQVVGVSDRYDQVPYDKVDYRVWRLKARYSPTLDISLRGTIQIVENALPDDDFVYTKDELLTNLLFAWNWNPGSWFYVVYDEYARETEPLAYNGPGARTLRMKLTYFFTVS